MRPLQTLLHEGDEPDPRFTLANERTLLAWNRTALALIAGGLAVGHLLDFDTALARILASVTPMVLGAVVSVASLGRWYRVQVALRHGRPLPLAAGRTLVAGVAVLAIALTVATIVDATAG